ncbi:hypothetical protein SAMN02910298_02345 [Pseudobutyrivibrio sp. YE44]|uniref:hypothetical protein n=1 Tax=Pseudobutyrivibrio sp. YE44 TaxID=1520802 RepID=UPI0008806F4B|nr:hypothetical protein [Pseudobutyrivibrio sp. YE44]SDB46749.1 hypothetical protein SAMN02910298_02345 [Pseudobutyrivibrio sp. YE44]
MNVKKLFSKGVIITLFFVVSMALLFSAYHFLSPYFSNEQVASDEQVASSETRVIYNEICKTEPEAEKSEVSESEENTDAKETSDSAEDDTQKAQTATPDSSENSSKDSTKEDTNSSNSDTKESSTNSKNDNATDKQADSDTQKNNETNKDDQSSTEDSNTTDENEDEQDQSDTDTNDEDNEKDEELYSLYSSDNANDRKLANKERLLSQSLLAVPKTKAKANTKSASNTSSAKTFNSLQDLINADLEAGATASTKGFRADGDGGAAKYKITSTESSKVDGVFCLKLANGNYANLVYDYNTPINVSLYNITPNNAVSDKINQFINIVKGKVIGIKFNSGTYYIDKPVMLASLNYYGNNTKFEVASNYSTKGFGIFSTQNTTDDFSIEIHDINFHWSITGAQQFLGNSGSDTVFMIVYNTKHFVINNCNFTIDNSSGVNKKATVLWFKQPKYIKNVTLKNSSFINNSGNSLPASQHLIGGCVWFSGTSKALIPVDNVNITNCNITSTLSDEALSFWFVKASNVTVSGGTITNTYCSSDNVVGFMDGIFTKVNFNNVTYNVNGPALHVSKMGNLWGASHMKFTGCTVNINCDNLKPYSNAVAIFYIYHDKSGTSIKDKSSIYLDSCKFNQNTKVGQYRSIVTTHGTSNKEVYIKNPTISKNVKLKESVANFEKTTNCYLYYAKSIKANSFVPYKLINSSNIKLHNIY